MFTEQEKQEFLSKVEMANNSGTVFCPWVRGSVDFGPNTLAIINSLREDGLILSADQVVNSTDHNSCYVYCLNTELGIRAAKNWFFRCQNPKNENDSYWV